MKTRMTFRLAPDLAEALKQLPNQTHFIETVLRDALGTTCPVCNGSGRVPLDRLRVTNLKGMGVSPLSRDEALYLKRLIRLAHELAATDLELSKKPTHEALEFSLNRNDSVLLSGTLDNEGAKLTAH